jgi:WXG100 family type VII secretion target
MAKIKINEEALERSSQALQAKINELTNLNSRLDSLIGRIGDSWDGEASQRYISMMLSYSKKAKSMIDVLNEYKKYVDSAVSDFQTRDKDSASRIRNSF